MREFFRTFGSIVADGVPIGFEEQLVCGCFEDVRIFCSLGRGHSRYFDSDGGVVCVFTYSALALVRSCLSGERVFLFVSGLSL